jgi:hypothetical protein
MHYRDTAWYTREVADLNAVIEGLETQKSQLAGIRINGTVNRKRTPEEQGILQSINGRLKKRREWAQQLATGDLSYFTTYQLVRLLAEVSGQLWSFAEAATLLLHRALHEGPGEKAIKLRLGLTLSSSTGRDLPNGEIKWLDNGKGSLQAMQVAQCGQKAWGAFIFEQAEAGLFKDLDPAVRQAFKDGELPRNVIDALPDGIYNQLMLAVSPGAVLQSYGDIYCTFNFGYIVVSASHTYAWRLVGISKGRPRYALRTDYITGKLLQSTSQQQLDVVA